MRQPRQLLALALTCAAAVVALAPGACAAKAGNRILILTTPGGGMRAAYMLTQGGTPSQPPQGRGGCASACGPGRAYGLGRPLAEAPPAARSRGSGAHLDGGQAERR